MPINKKKKQTDRWYGIQFFDPRHPSVEMLNGDAFKAHLNATYGITEIKGTQQMSMHVDGSDFFTYDYDIKIGDLDFKKHTCTKRTGMDAYIWGGGE